MNKQNEIIDTDDLFPFKMAICVKQMRGIMDARLIETGQSVTSEQWVILTHLAKQDGVSQQSLAARSGRTKVATLKLIKRLEKNRCVIRRRDPFDKRVNRVYLTRKGRKAQQSLAPLIQETISVLRREISDNEMELLQSVIKKLNSNASLD